MSFPQAFEIKKANCAFDCFEDFEVAEHG